MKTEKRLMIAITVTRKTFQRTEISEAGWIRLNKNIADRLTELGNCEALEQPLEKRRIDTKVEQRIVRKQSEAETTEKGS